ncbi:MAG: hypothetical protein ACOX2O_07440 [Bdellovibrionota bacterium]|jgi:hypothetical protein
MFYDTNCPDIEQLGVVNLGIKSSLAGMLQKLQHFSALALCEDDVLRENVAEMIGKISDNATFRETLSKMPEAALPLSMAIQNSSDPQIKDHALSCLKNLLEYQERHSKKSTPII